ncbi:nuclear transport factor 2 family protein [Streptomyces sp. NPDC127098]|uniref:nuclear transport factor 2 family protein n=1 Tax=Streptomyces sp. NPDC127098 TaxID=3347137 RepID=UPI00364EB704
MTAPHHTIAVLGLGRMGAAITDRLAEHDLDVVGWTRSGRAADVRRTVGDPDEAVAKADVVLLALFDGRACAEVVDRVHGALRPEAIVVNTSTVGPDEAAGLARRLGAAYVHAPVLGSVPAVSAGALRILAAGEQAAFDRARPVLDALGTVRRVADAATAAALKLVANCGLAGAVLALRDALRQAEALGLSRDQVLDVLELGPLGGLVARKRPFLLGEPTTAEFTIGALAKDLALLAAASGRPPGGAAELAAIAAADPEADIAVAATVPAVDDAVRDALRQFEALGLPRDQALDAHALGPHGALAAAGPEVDIAVAVDDAVLAPLRAYVRGHATGDPAHFRDAFLPTAHIEGMRDGAFVSWRLDAYCSLFPGRPAQDEATRTRRVDAVDVHGTVATATMTLHHGADTFTDVFLLVRAEAGWRIANKAYHRHT